MKKFLTIVLFLSLAANIAGLALFDRALFYKNKIAADEGGFLNEGLRITNPTAIREANFPNLVVLLGGSLFRYWFQPINANSQLVNYGGIEESTGDTYAKLKMVAAELAPEFVVINAGFCQIHTTVHNNHDVAKAIDSIMHRLHLMVDEAKSHGIIPALSTLTPVRPVYLLPYSGLIELPSQKKNIENEAIRSYNTRMAQLAKDENLFLIDFNKALADETGQLRKEYALTDGEHLNQNGYRVMNEFLVDQLAIMRSQSKM